MKPVRIASGSPFHPYFVANWKGAVIRLNGFVVSQLECCTANATDGWIEMYKRGTDGEILMKHRFEPMVRRVSGDVEIETFYDGAVSPCAKRGLRRSMWWK